MDPAATVEAAPATVEAGRPPADSAIPDGDDSLPETPADQPTLPEDGLDIAYRFLRRQIAEQPLTVLAAALVAGLLVGALLSDRR
jgi:hypothetical protein